MARLVKYNDPTPRVAEVLQFPRDVIVSLETYGFPYETRNMGGTALDVTRRGEHIGCLVFVPGVTVAEAN